MWWRRRDSLRLVKLAQCKLTSSTFGWRSESSFLYESKTPIRGYSLSWWRRRDSNPLTTIVLHEMKLGHNHDRTTTNPCRSKHLRQNAILPENRTHTPSEHSSDRRVHGKCALCVHQLEISPDLKKVIELWDDPPEAVREAVLTIVRSVRSDMWTLRN